MNAVTQAMQANDGKRDRLMVTPEGLALPLRVASRGARAGALLLDLAFIFTALLVTIIVLAFLGFSVFNVQDAPNGPLEFIGVILILVFWLSRYGYFLWFELGPRAATPGKRLLGIRVAARPVDGEGGAHLTAEAVIARNLMRDVEVFLPLFFMLGGANQAGVAGWAAFIWLAVFVTFPFFNKDGLRAGDLVAGTWVVEVGKTKLQSAMSLAPDRTSQYRFGDAELSVYGEHELQVLESVLRQDNEEALREVAEAICRKIGWTVGNGDEREFLEAFYAALRAHLERGLRFGRRKADKHS